MYCEIIDNKITKIIRVGGSYKNISFGSNAPKEDYINAGLYELIDTVEPITEFQYHGDTVLSIDEVSKIVTRTTQAIDKPAEEIAIIKQKTIEKAIQLYMDTKAIEKGYDSILSACTYASFTNPFQTEGQAFVEWRGNVWAYCYQVLANVQSGSRIEPTIDELIIELPKLVLP